MERRRLSSEEIEEGLQQLPGWKLVNGKMHKTFQFASFAEAIGWLTTVAILADKIDHHPEWFNVYNRVTVDLVTHDLDAVSSLDLHLAKKMESLGPD